MTTDELRDGLNAHERRLTVVEERVQGIAASVIKEAQFERTIIPLREKMDALATILTESQKSNQEQQRQNQQAQRATQEEIQKLARAIGENSTATKANSDANQEIMRRIGEINEENMRQAAKQDREQHEAELKKKQAEIDELRAREAAQAAAAKAADEKAEQNRFDVKFQRWGALFLMVVSVSGAGWAIFQYLVTQAR